MTPLLLRRLFSKKIRNTPQELAALHQASRLSPEPSVPPLSFDYLAHPESIQAALNQSRRQVYELLVSQRDQVAPVPRVVNILDQVQQKGIPVRSVQKAQINSYARHQPHHQMVLKVSRLTHQPLSTQLPRLSVLLDQVTDPQNVGSIVQTCHLMGAALLATPQNRCPLTPTVSKVSGGALEMMDVYSLDLTGIQKLKEQNVVFLCSGMGEQSVDIGERAKVEQLVGGRQVVVVLGNEGKGVSDVVRSECEGSVHIVQKNREWPYSLVDSLNVAASCAVLLHGLRM